MEAGLCEMAPRPRHTPISHQLLRGPSASLPFGANCHCRSSLWVRACWGGRLSDACQARLASWCCGASAMGVTASRWLRRRSQRGSQSVPLLAAEHCCGWRCTMLRTVCIAMENVCARTL